MKSFSRSSERGPKAEQAKIESTINLCSAINRIRTVDRRTAEPVYQGLKDLLGKHVAQHLKLPADLVLMCCMGHDHADLVDKETCRKVYLLLEELQGSIDAETRNGQNEVKKIEKEIEQKAELERRLLEERRQSAASASGRKSDKQMQSQPSIDAEIKKVRNEKSKLENDAEWLRGELTELVEIKVKVKGSALLDNRKEDVRKRNRAFAKELSSCAGRLSKPPRLVELLIAELRQGRYEKRRPE